MKTAHLTLVLSFLLWSGVLAAQEKPSAAILDLRGSTVDAEMITTFSAIIRNEAQQLEKYKIVNKLPINLDDIFMALGCSDVTQTCLDQAAKQLKVQVLVFGEIEKQEDIFKVTVKLYDAKSDKILNRLTRSIQPTDDPAIAFRREIQDFFASQTENPVTRLQIGSNVTGARIEIEGTFVGKAPLERKGLPAGTYKVTVSAPNHAPYEGSVSLTEGEDASIWAKLTPTTTATENNVVENDPIPYEQPDPILKRTTDTRSLNWPALVVAGSGVALIGASLIVGGMLKGTENDINTSRDNGTLTALRYDELKRRGESQQLIHYVHLGTGVGIAAGGAMWFLLAPTERQTVQLHISPNQVNATIHF